MVLATMLLGALGVALFFLLLRRLTPKEKVPAPPPKVEEEKKEKKEVNDESERLDSVQAVDQRFDPASVLFNA